jgi:ribonuclease HI
MILRIFTDGASRGNPGHAGIGYVVKKDDGSSLFHYFEYIGTVTNNVAEYTALIRCLENLKNRSEIGVHSEAIFHTDSELMSRQLNGQYKVKDEVLKKLFVKSKSLLMSLPLKFTIRHVPRELNKEADILANKAIDTHLGKNERI